MTRAFEECASATAGDCFACAACRLSHGQASRPPLGRLLRAPFNMARGPAVAAAPAKAAIEYDVLLTGSVHHMTIVTLEKPGNEDPLQKLWNAGQRTLDSMLSAASRGKGGS